MARLETIRDTAKNFVRIRLTRIEDYDLNLFEFDYDLTMMIFFLDPEGKKIYGRYGQRNADNPDDWQSLDGLKYTMESVLKMHTSAKPEFAPRHNLAEKYVREAEGATRAGRCYHCHNVKETLNRELKLQNKWTREKAFHFPLPENIGLEMEVKRGNVIAKVLPNSPAARLKLATGDRIVKAGEVPVHSIADLQFALEHTPAPGELTIQWQRGKQNMSGTLKVDADWRKSDITWRPSMQGFLPTLPLTGKDLTTDEKTALGLKATDTAFRLKDSLSSRTLAAGFLPKDIILGITKRELPQMNDSDLFYFVQRDYLKGDKISMTVLRDGQKKAIEFELK